MGDLNAIWKYELSVRHIDPQPLEIPKGATFLTTQIQNSAIAMWFEVSRDEEKETRLFQIFLTGDANHFEDDHVYRGTVQFEHLVVHVYEIRKSRKGGYIKGAGE